jgi:hypothetical protein
MPSLSIVAQAPRSINHLQKWQRMLLGMPWKKMTRISFFIVLVLVLVVIKLRVAAAPLF